MKSQKQERMVVFILGNGFDLAHGLKTRYTDFLAADPKEGLQKEKLQSNIWFKHFNEKQKEIGENWFNLEQEIYNVITKIRDKVESQVICEMLNGSVTYNPHENLTLHEFFKQHVISRQRSETEDDFSFSDHQTINKEKTKKEANELYSSLRFFVDQFGNYLSEQLKQPDLTQKQKFLDFLENKILKEYNKIRIVNFNYTNIFERLYGEYLKNKGIIDIMYYHIHGSLDKNNLVLGTQDLPNKDKSSPFRIFTKKCQRLNNKDYDNFLNELEETNRKSITFHIIGHSLDEVDHKILNNILCYSGSEGNRRDINIYRYNDNENLEILKNIEEILQCSYEKRVLSPTPLKEIF
ncbi:MAG: hypothetical protein J6P38_03120 [Acetobacter sp.]|nr:hypothetical protein [Acetobacter sp.]